MASPEDLCASSTKKWPSASQRDPTGTGAPPVINVLEINWGGGKDYEADSACFQLFLLDLFSWMMFCRITELLRLEVASKVHLVQHPCSEKGYHHQI